MTVIIKSETLFAKLPLCRIQQYFAYRMLQFHKPP